LGLNLDVKDKMCINSKNALETYSNLIGFFKKKKKRKKERKKENMHINDIVSVILKCLSKVILYPIQNCFTQLCSQTSGIRKLNNISTFIALSACSEAQVI